MVVRGGQAAGTGAPGSNLTFHSPPARRPGETSLQPTTEPPHKKFQSGPSPKARGNARPWPRAPGRGRTVSIRPQPEGQGKPRRLAGGAVRAGVSIRPQPEGQGKRG